VDPGDIDRQVVRLTILLEDVTEACAPHNLVVTVRGLRVHRLHEGLVRGGQQDKELHAALGEIRSSDKTLKRRVA